MNGCTYVGKHHQKKENDGYVTSSSYYENKGGKDILYKREILLDNLPDEKTCEIMETICILEDRAENINNVNYNKGAWMSNQFDRGFSGKENGMYGKHLKDLMTEDAFEAMNTKRKKAYELKWKSYKDTHNGMVPYEYRKYRIQQRNAKFKEINKQISAAHKEHEKYLRSLPKKWYYNTQTLKETYWYEQPGPEWELGRVPHELWDDAKKQSYANKHKLNTIDRMTEEAKEIRSQKLSDSMKGRLCFTNGTNNIYLRQGEDIPDGYWRGCSFEKTPLYISTRRKKDDKRWQKQ